MISTDAIPAECRDMVDLLDPRDRQAVRWAWNTGLFRKRERQPGEVLSAGDLSRSDRIERYQRRIGKS